MTLPLDPREVIAGAETCCPLCGFRFTEARAGCVACPLHTNCGGQCCPRCGYALAGRSASVDLIHKAARSLRRLFSRQTRQGGGR